jgi:hypothetical protein
MIKTGLKIAPDIIDAYKDQLKKAPQTVRVFAGKTVLNDGQAFLHTQLQTNWYPAERKLRPAFRFATAKSRRFYFASNGAGKGIPYQRTNNAWTTFQLQFNQDEFSFTVVDHSSIAKWLYGPRQVPGHFDTGWRAPTGQMERLSSMLMDRMIDGWISIVDIKGLA